MTDTAIYYDTKEVWLQNCKSASEGAFAMLEFRELDGKKTAWKQFENDWGIYVVCLEDNIYNATVLGFYGDGLENSDIVFETPVCDMVVTSKSSEAIGELIIQIQWFSKYKTEIEPPQHQNDDEDIDTASDSEAWLDEPIEEVVSESYYSDNIESDEQAGSEGEWPPADYWY